MSDAAKRPPLDSEPLLAALAANEISNEDIDALSELFKEDGPATRDLARRTLDALMIREWVRAEDDERFAMETEEAVAQLRRDSDSVFVSDTMQRVRTTACKGRQKADRSQTTGPLGRSTVRRQGGRQRMWAPTRLLFIATASAACVLAVLWLGPFGHRDTAGPTTASGSSDQRLPALKVETATAARRGNAELLASGDHLCPGDMITTGPAGKAQLLYLDDTSLVLGSGVELLLLPGQMPADATAPSKRMLLRAGELTATVSPQPVGQPVVLLTPHATLSVIGTRFTVQVVNSQTHLQVAEGTVRMERGEDHFLVKQGTSAVADGTGLRMAGADLAPRYENLMEKLNFAETSGDGEWLVRLTKEGPVLCQTNTSCTSATLRLAPPKWKTGYLTGQCRFVGPIADKRSISFRMLVRSRSSSEQVDAHPIPYLTIRPPSSSLPWFNINVRFRLSSDGSLFTETLPSWCEDRPPPFGRIGALGRESTDPRTPAAAPVQNVELFGLSIECQNAGGEFRRLRFYTEPDVPELHPERMLFEKIAAQKGSGMDTEKATASPSGSWHLTQTDDGLQILQNASGTGPFSLNLGILPHRRVFLSGQIIVLSPEQTAGVPTELTDDRTRVSSVKEQLAFDRLPLSRNTERVDSPCFLAVPSGDPSGPTATVIHFHADRGEPFGIPKGGTRYRFVAFLDLDCMGKRSEGHAYWTEGETMSPFWCIHGREQNPPSIQEPFSLQLYCKGQRILWRNLKIVPY